MFMHEESLSDSAGSLLGSLVSLWRFLLARRIMMIIPALGQDQVVRANCLQCRNLMPSVSDLGAHKYIVLTGGLVLYDNSTLSIV